MRKVQGNDVRRIKEELEWQAFQHRHDFPKELPKWIQETIIDDAARWQAKHERNQRH